MIRLHIPALLLLLVACPGPPGEQGPAGTSGQPGAPGAPGSPGEAGEVGASSLIRLEPERPGANCSRGGTGIHSGLDSNRNGELDDDEISDSQYVCNPCTDIVSGDIRATVELDLLPLLGKCRLTGRLTIAPEFTGSLASLDQLEQVSIVEMQSNPSIDVFSLPELSKASAVILAGNTALATVLLPKLQTIEIDERFLADNQGNTGGFIIQANPQLRGLAVDTLLNVDGIVSIFNDENLRTFSLAQLETIGGYLEILDNDDLDSFTLPALHSVGGDVTISGNLSLPNCYAADLVGRLDSIGGQTRVNGNTGSGNCL